MSCSPKLIVPWRAAREPAKRRVALCLLALSVALTPALARAQEAAPGAELRGHVHDSAGQAAAQATVLLQLSTAGEAAPARVTHSDDTGAYRFTGLAPGSYLLRAEGQGSAGSEALAVGLAHAESKQIDLILSRAPAPAAAKAPEYFDEPQFTVAGVTSGSNLGGHGSDTAVRTTEALAKATVSLGPARDPPRVDPRKAASEAASAPSALESEAAAHHALAEAAEKAGNSLEAVREYQRAAELDPSEPNLFAWGTELLAHRAAVPATEVLARGHRSHPKSARMLVALGVAWYARGDDEQAAQALAGAADLDPADPTPYLFLGKMLSAEIAPPAIAAQRLERFAALHPDDALANYYAALALWKQALSAGTADAATAERVEDRLREALRLDPRCAPAWLELGIVEAQHKNFPQAISAYRKAIEVAASQPAPAHDDTLEQAHYRLAQAYFRVGDQARGEAELKLHSQLARKTKASSERERREIQEFVVFMQGETSGAQKRP